MSDLISRQKTIDEVDKYFDGLPIQGHYDMVQIIKNMPTIDAVPVVRCKDCKNMYEDGGGTVCVYGAFVDCITPNDFFCAFGERSEDGET